MDGASVLGAAGSVISDSHGLWGFLHYDIDTLTVFTSALSEMAYVF